MRPSEADRAKSSSLVRSSRPVQIAPIKAVLAFLIADRVDEQNQKRRTRYTPAVSPGEARVTAETIKSFIYNFCSVSEDSSYGGTRQPSGPLP